MRTPRWRLWVNRAVVFLLVWVGLCVASWFFGGDPQPALVGLTLLAAAAVLLLLLEGSAAGAPADWRLPDDLPVRQVGEDPRLSALVRMVTAHQVARESGGDLPARLMALADRRLVAHHGISRLADPDRAAAVLGPELTELAALSANPNNASRGPRLPLARIETLIDRIEKL